MPKRTNDLYRCNYHYTDDRRCAEPHSGPGMAYCRAPERKLERMQQRQSAPPPPPPSPPPTAAMDAFTQFLAAHPLDSATRIAHASQLTMLLLASGRITTREFNSFQSGFRHLSKTYKFVATETKHPDLFLKHQAANAEAFSASTAELLPAIAADQAAEAAAHEAAAQAHAAVVAAAAAAEPHPSNTFPTRPPAPPLTIEDYLRNQDIFRAAVAAETAATSTSTTDAAAPDTGRGGPTCPPCVEDDAPTCPPRVEDDAPTCPPHVDDTAPTHPSIPRETNPSSPPQPNANHPTPTPNENGSHPTPNPTPRPLFNSSTPSPISPP